MIKVFIHTNNKQLFGAYLSKFTFIENGGFNEEDIEIINIDKSDYINTNVDKEIIRNGKKYIWKINDLQSFTLMRFFPPKKMNYEGYSIVVDPDVFCLKNMQLDIKKIFKSNSTISVKSNGKKGYASSVMLINNSKFKRYNVDEKIKSIFDKKIDYSEIMNLNFINESEINLLEEKWNSYDNISHDTILLHLTNRITQPWKTGLKVDFTQTYNKYVHGFIPVSIYKFLQKIIFKKEIPPFKNYLQHPNSNIEKLFMKIVSKAVEKDFISQEFINKEISNKNVRNDIFNFI